MQWSKPEFQEITLNMEVTAYVNTEGDIRKPQERMPDPNGRREPFRDSVQNADRRQ